MYNLHYELTTLDVNYLCVILNAQVEEEKKYATLRIPIPLVLLKKKT